MLFALAPTPSASQGIDVLTVARLCGLLVPLVVAAVTKKYASQGLKSILNVLLSAVSGAVALVLAGDGAHSVAEFFNAILNTFVTSIIAYYGAWKPTGLAGTVTEKTKDFGIGSPPELETADKGAEDGGTWSWANRPQRATVARQPEPDRRSPKMLVALLLLAVLALLLGLFTAAKFLIVVAILLALVGAFVHFGHHDTTV